MSVSSLVFQKGKAVERLAFVSQNFRAGPRISMLVQTVLLVLAAVLTAKGFLVDYPAAARFLDPNTIMTFQTSFALSFLAASYWFFSGLHQRVCSCQQWYAQALFGLLIVVLSVVLFFFGLTHRFTNVVRGYGYGDLVWFAFGFLAISLIPWTGGAYFVFKFKRPLRVFIVAGLVLRAIFFAGLIVLALFLNGKEVYNEQTTSRILAMVGFNNSLHGFITILWCLLFLVAFASIVASITSLTVGFDSLFKSTFKSERSAFFSVFCTTLVTFGFIVDHVTSANLGTLVWVVLASSLALAGTFLAVNLLFKVPEMVSLLKLLTVCLQLLIILTVSFALQYFVPATDSQRAFSFVLTVPALLLLAFHLYMTGVANSSTIQRPLLLMLSAAGSSGLTYIFLVSYGFANLLPGEIPAKTLFNFILIGTVLFVAFYACCRLFLATNGATRLLAIRAATVQKGNR